MYWNLAQGTTVTAQGIAALAVELYKKATFHCQFAFMGKKIKKLQEDRSQAENTGSWCSQWKKTNTKFKPQTPEIS